MTESAVPAVFSVSQLVKSIRRTVRRAWKEPVTVRGEIANLSRQPSGHVYFTLRDEDAALRCAMFRSAVRLLRFRLENGASVEARGLLGVYVPRGDMQLVVEEMHAAGLGAQTAALEALKHKLRVAGLMDPERKRSLPLLPRRVGVVTSPRGAAVRDLLEILRTRAPRVGVIVAPTPVQGEGAALAITGAIERLGGSGLVDVLIVARGGGSLEDLWSFNTEPVARAIAACPVPVVSGVGHESDVTVADLVADVRAATPTHAAQLVVPDVHRLEGGLWQEADRLGALAARMCRTRGERLGTLASSPVFRRPSRLITDQSQRLDELATALERGLHHARRVAVGVVGTHPGRLVRALGARQREARYRLEHLGERLTRSAAAVTPARAARVAALERQLAALGPRQVLGRGYVLARRADGGAVVPRAAAVESGERLQLDWIDGRALSRVERVTREDVAGKVEHD